MAKLRFLVSLVLCSLACGCLTSTTITNLTASRVTRNSDGLYRFEVAFDTNQRSLRQETIQPQVLIGTDFYPMQPGPVVKNRWETLVPVAATQKFVYYQYKFDFQYNGIPVRRPDSRLSPLFKLEILEP